jgi:polyisoprenoid-binding protein YceI
MKKILIRSASVASLLFLQSFNIMAAPQKFVTDPYHTNITWHANHFGFSNPNGKFAKSEGVIMFDEQKPAESSVNVTIDTTSIVTGIEAFDKHLKSTDFFNVEKFKTATFKSTKVVVEKDKTAKIQGNFTLLGVTKPIVLNAKFNKSGENPFTKKQTIGFSAETTIKRSEFGMNYAIGGVSDDVKINIEVEANLA